MRRIINDQPGLGGIHDINMPLKITEKICRLVFYKRRYSNTLQGIRTIAVGVALLNHPLFITYDNTHSRSIVGHISLLQSFCFQYCNIISHKWHK